MKIFSYSLQQTLASFSNGEPLSFLFFWGHSADDNAPIGKQCLSQWYPAGFTLDGVHYRTAEHWMMAQKAKLFVDEQTFAQIIAAETPKAAKALGRNVANFSASLWDEHKYPLVVTGNLHKFTQHPELFRFLKSTGDQYLVEASPVDRIWGIGLAENDVDATNPFAWEGENLLGFALMEVRDQIAEIEALVPLPNPMLPPWLAYPEYEQGDLFWRMGSGEHYLTQFSQWYLSLSISQQKIYQISYPEPQRWRFY